MKTSDQINELATALSKAQGKIKAAVRDNNNPYFHSKYADLASHWEAIRETFSQHGLSFVQSCRSCAEGVEVETRLLHSSGQWMGDSLTIPLVKKDAQAIGSAITYARRYSLSAFAGTAPEDDDGNAAADSMKKEHVKPAPPQAPKGPQYITKEQYEALKAEAKKSGCDMVLILKALGIAEPKHILASSYKALLEDVRNGHPDYKPAVNLASKEQWTLIEQDVARTGILAQDLVELEKTLGISDPAKMTFEQADKLISKLIQMPTAAASTEDENIPF